MLVYTSVTIPDVETTKDVLDQFIRAFPQYTEEVLISMLPILAVFMLFQIKTRKYHRRQLLRMCVGFLYTIAGLVLFLVGVNIGFAPVGNLLGEQMVSSSYQWLLIPVGF